MKKILIWGFAFLLSVGAYGKELNEYLGKVQTLEKSKKYKGAARKQNEFRCDRCLTKWDINVRRLFLLLFSM